MNPLALAAVLSLSIAAAVQFVYAGGPTEVLPLPKELASVEIIPPFSAKDRTGEETFQRRHLEDLVKRTPGIKRVALVYFATYCAPCAAGVRRLKAARPALKENGVFVVLVNVGEGEDDPAPVLQWVNTHGTADFQLIFDVRKQLVNPYGLARADGVAVMPRTLVLDAKLKPLLLLGTEGDDFPEILWKLNRGQTKIGAK